MPGDVLIGLPSAGLHTNGYSLARRVLFEHRGLDGRHGRAGARRDGRRRAAGAAPLVSAGRAAAARTPGWSRGWRTSPAAASPRTCRACCPKGARAEIDLRAWTVPPLFQLLQERGGSRRDEMFRAFNMGIGLIRRLCARQKPSASSTPWRADGEPHAVSIGFVVSGDRRES